MLDRWVVLLCLWLKVVNEFNIAIIILKDTFSKGNEHLAVFQTLEEGRRRTKIT